MTGVGPIATVWPTQQAQPSRDRNLADLAARQHGVVALAQLRMLGMSASAVRDRVATGRLHRVHRGAYAVGHPLLPAEGRWMAAVLSCGPGSVLSHRSAAALLGLRPSARTGIDVSAPGRAGRSRIGIDAHRAATLAAEDLTSVRGIPCTTVARTLLDLAEVVDCRALERACEQAEMLRLLDLRAVDDVLKRAAGRRGAPILRAVFADLDFGATLTRSELEERFLALCASSGVPRPRVNACVNVNGGSLEVDFLWPERRLIVETDGRRAHGTRQAFERDRRRDQRLALAGWRVVRFTWRQVVHEPAEVAETLKALTHDGDDKSGIRGRT